MSGKRKLVKLSTPRKALILVTMFIFTVAVVSCGQSYDVNSDDVRLSSTITVER